jgi:expansin (peptidoglycan-binding protein)
VRLTLVLLAAATAGIVLVASREDPGTTPLTAATAVPATALVQQAPPERSVIGNLDKIDVAAMQIVVATSTGKMAFRVKQGATIRQGSRTLAAADLAHHKGERVKIRYLEVDGQRHTDWIMLAAPPRRTK